LTTIDQTTAPVTWDHECSERHWCSDSSQLNATATQHNRSAGYCHVSWADTSLVELKVQDVLLVSAVGA